MGGILGSLGFASLFGFLSSALWKGGGRSQRGFAVLCGLLAMGDMLIGPMREAMYSLAYGPAAGTLLRTSTLGEDAGLRGAAAGAFERLDGEQGSRRRYAGGRGARRHCPDA